MTPQGAGFDNCLMVGLTFRSVFVDSATGILLIGCVGYESF